MVHRFVMGLSSWKGGKSKVTVKTTTLIHGSGEVLKPIEEVNP